MAEDAMNVAVSSPADHQAVLDNMSQQERTEWEATGNLPKTADPAPATDKDKADAAPAKDAAEPASESAPDPDKEKTDTPPAKKGKNAEDRKAELAAEIRELLKKRAELRKDLEAPKDEKKAEPSPAKAEKSAAPAKPTPDDFNSYEDYTEALADWKAEQKVTAAINNLKAEQAKAAEEAQKASKQSEADKANKQLEETWKQRVAEATKRHPDFVEVALSDEVVAKIPQGGMIDAFILKLEKGPEVLYHLAANPDEIDRLVALDPLDQARELVKLEISLSDKAPLKKLTSAPKPPTEVSGKATVPEDEAQAALARGDFRAYERAMNARERKG